MSVRYRCALCGRITAKKDLDSHVCKTCHAVYDINADWVQELVKSEAAWHKSQIKHASTINFSRLRQKQDGRAYDGDDMVNGDLPFPHRRAKRTGNSQPEVSTSHVPAGYLDDLETILAWEDIAQLTDVERQALEVIALFMREQTISLEAASQILSDIEGKEIVPFEFLDRLNRARKKLIEAGIAL